MQSKSTKLKFIKEGDGILTNEEKNILKKKGESAEFIRALNTLQNKTYYKKYISNIVEINKTNNKISNQIYVNLKFFNIGPTNNDHYNIINDVRTSYTDLNNLKKYIKKYIGKNNLLKNIFFNYIKLYDLENNYCNKNANIYNNYDLFIYYFKNMNPKELATYIFEEKSGIEKISFFKPVGTLHSKPIKDPFYFLWYKFTKEERINFKNELSTLVKDEIDIYLTEGKRNNAIFYSVKYFPILAYVYDYNLDEAFNILCSIPNTNKKKDFIYTSFGDNYKKNDNLTNLTPNGKKNDNLTNLTPNGKKNNNLTNLTPNGKKNNNLTKLTDNGLSKLKIYYNIIKNIQNKKNNK